MNWNTLVAFWESIPGPIRTIINGFLGLLLAALVGYLATGDLSWKDAVLIPFTQMIVRFLNPVDQQYGVAPSTSAGE